MEIGNSTPVVTKSLITADGQTYVYDYVAASNASKPTVLLLHGFPASRHDWKPQVVALAAEGFGVIAPDLLGFGDSSKPTSLDRFRLKGISGHLEEIVHAESLQDVVGVGHDWGSTVLSNAVARHSALFTKLVFVSVGYQASGLFADFDAINKFSQAMYGYMQYAYWYFFNSYNAADLITNNVSIDIRTLLEG